MKFGLIGKTLKHSYSKIIHEMFEAYSYDLLSMKEEEIPSFLENPEYSGFNVTIPYKKTIMPFCDFISDEAKKIGSVNTVIKKDGKLLGYNTDYAGFLAMTKRAEIDFSGKKVAILGSGGTYSTAYAVIGDLGAREIVSVSRCGEYNYENISMWCDAEIIVNTTPVGMFPNNGDSILNINDFKNLEGVIDVIYNPLKTRLVFDAEQKGIKATGGLYMLIFQAKEAFEIFTGNKLSDDITEKIYQKLLKDTQNIVLIGMPGCGKTTAGNFLSEYTHRKLLDTDALIEIKANMKPSEIIEKFGENHFRNIETECVKEAGKQTGKIISCGGGVVKRKENFYHLKQNGKIFFINRSINKLETVDRPLSKDMAALLKIEKERTPLYEALKDITIENNGDLSSFKDKLIAGL